MHVPIGVVIIAVAGLLILVVTRQHEPEHSSRPNVEILAG